VLVLLAFLTFSGSCVGSALCLRALFPVFAVPALGRPGLAFWFIGFDWIRGAAAAAVGLTGETILRGEVAFGGDAG